VEEFISSKLTMTYGAQDLKLTLRENEGAFFLDVSESNTPGGFQALDGAVATRAARVRDTVEYSGFVFNYGSLKDFNYQVDVVWGVTLETGAARTNDKLTGVNVSYKLPGEKNVAKVLLAQISESSVNRSIMDIGLGVNYFEAVPNLEIYFEYHTQSGTLANNGVNAAGQATNVDQVASAYRIGGRYDFVDNPLKPYVDFSMWNLTGGNDSATYKSGSTKYTENNHFVSYENCQSTLILEDHLLGLDLDSNYNAIKIEAGITTSLGLGGASLPLHVKMLLGQFSLNSEPWTVDPVLGAVKTDSGLGMEIDVLATLEYNENTSFVVGLGMLSSAKFFGSVRYADPTPTNPAATESFDSMTLFMFGAKVKF
jgi:hypothetical protein